VAFSSIERAYVSFFKIKRTFGLLRVNAISTESVSSIVFSTDTSSSRISLGVVSCAISAQSANSAVRAANKRSACANAVKRKTAYAEAFIRISDDVGAVDQREISYANAVKASCAVNAVAFFAAFLACGLLHNTAWFSGRNSC